MNIPSFLRSRYTIAAGVVIVVAGTVGIARAVGGTRDYLAPPQSSWVTTPPSEPPLPDVTPASPTAQASASPTPNGTDNDGVIPQTPVGPAVSAGPTGPSGVVDEASQFVGAWCAHSGATPDAWRAGLAPHATPALRDKLKDTDPERVPASHVTGQITMHDGGDSYVIAAVPVDTGLVTLRLLAVDGRWLVDGVGWEGS